MIQANIVPSFMFVFRIISCLIWIVNFENGKDRDGGGVRESKIEKEENVFKHDLYNPLLNSEFFICFLYVNSLFFFFLSLRSWKSIPNQIQPNTHEHRQIKMKKASEESKNEKKTFLTFNIAYLCIHIPSFAFTILKCV